MLQRQEIGLGKGKCIITLSILTQELRVLSGLVKKELDMICEQILLRNLHEQTNYMRVIE